MQKEKKINFTMLFKILYLLNVLLAFNCFVAEMKIMKVISMVTIIFGVILICQELPEIKQILHYKYMWILLLFGVSYTISLIVNGEYGFIGNIKGGIWLGLQLFLLYYIKPGTSREQIEKEIKTLFVVLISYTTVANVAGLVMMICRYGGRTFLPDGGISLYGFIWGRLWGSYTDPNHGAAITTVSIIATIYLIKNCKKWKVLLIFSIACNYLYIVFSDSRTAKVCCIVALFIAFLIRLINIKETEEKLCLGKHCIKYVGIMLLFVFSFSAVKNSYNFIIEKMEESVEEENLEEKLEIEEMSVGRESDIENDYSNRRFDIWKSGIEIFKENPVFGISFRNIHPYAQKEMPETYIVNNDHGDFDSFHNVVIDVLVSQGMVGIILILLMGGFYAVYLIKKIFVEKMRMNCKVNILFVIVITLLVESMFVSSIFYVNSPETVLFWICLGYLMFSVNENKVKIKEG